MAFKLNKSELSRRDEILNDLRTRLDSLSALLDKPIPTEIPNKVMEAAATFTVVLTEAEDFRDEVATRLRDEYDEKSEFWQDSDRGMNVYEMLEQWEGADFSDCGLDILNPELDGLEDYIEEFENLPIEI